MDTYMLKQEWLTPKTSYPIWSVSITKQIMCCNVSQALNGFDLFHVQNNTDGFRLNATIM